MLPSFVDQGSNMAHQHQGDLDLIVLDMVLPKKTGLEILMEIGDFSVPILCVTGNDLVEEFKELQELGATDYILKSTPVEEIT